MNRVIIGDARNLPLAEFGRYGVIVADPPWAYEQRERLQGVTGPVYDVMITEDICRIPVASLAADNCILFLWGTWPKVPDAVVVEAAWGFEHVTGFPWIKTTRNGAVRYGVGFWVAGCSEYVLIGRRGHVSPPEIKHLGLISPSFNHSRKPESIHKLAETLPGPYLELFGRRARAGWDVFGNDVMSDEDIPLVAALPEPLDTLSER